MKLLLFLIPALAFGQQTAQHDLSVAATAQASVAAAVNTLSALVDQQGAAIAAAQTSVASDPNVAAINAACPTCLVTLAAAIAGQTGLVAINLVGAGTTVPTTTPLPEGTFVIYITPQVANSAVAK